MRGRVARRRRAGGRFATVAGLLALTWSVFLAGCGRETGPREAAHAFFQLISTGRVQEAYDSAAFAFQAQQSRQLFETTIKETGLNNIVSWTFDEPEFDNRSAKIRGTFISRRGLSFPLNITLTQDSGAWRVYALKPPRSIETGVIENRFSLVGKGPGFVDAVNRQPVPDEATLKKMVLDVMLMFNDAVQKKSFTDFYNKVSRLWQEQVSDRQLQRAFQAFIDRNVDISAITDLEPVFATPAEVSSDGLLLVAGEYPTKPFRVKFALKFIYEVPRWRLFGIDVSLQRHEPAAAVPPPSPGAR